MSRLAVSAELLAKQLFSGAQPQLRVVGASFDEVRQVVLLDIEGPGVPDAEEVVAICRVQPPLRVEFQSR